MNKREKDRGRMVGAILWPSFLLAALATIVFFAFVDPVELHAISFERWRMSRAGGYSLGFFMFWAATAGSSFLTWMLLRRSEDINAEQGQARLDT